MFTHYTTPTVDKDTKPSRLPMQGSSGFGWEDFANTATGFGRAARKKTEEEFYGFEDFLKDVEKDFSERRKKKARPGGPPKSLLEELAEIGSDVLEEFVEFLESQLDGKGDPEWQKYADKARWVLQS